MIAFHCGYRQLLRLIELSPLTYRLSSSFSGIVIEKNPSYEARLANNINAGSLPEGDVEVDVQFSTLNYKDGLAITGKVITLPCLIVWCYFVDFAKK